MTITCPEARWMFQQGGGQLFRSPDQNGQTPRRMGTLEVGQGIPDHPDSLIWGNSRAVESQIDRIRRRLVAFRVLGADRASNQALPAEVSHLGPQVFAHLVADDRHVAPCFPAAR